MKQTRLWLTTIAALLCSLTASAHYFEVDGIYYNITSSADLTVAVTYRGNYYDSYSNEYSGTVTIPSTVTYNSKTYSVTSIGYRAFYGCSSLTSITIPESVTSIGNCAFEGCSSLTAITLPEGVTSIGGWAFYNCSSLTSITIPESVTSIEDYAFYNCSSLTTITIPEGVTSIGSSAFEDCSSLTTITIPEGVTSIGKSAFSGCRSLTSITIPEGVTSIGESAFSVCRSLTSITIPEGVTSIRNQAFAYCSSLTSITIPEGVTSIGNQAFDGCTSLKDIIFEDGSGTLTLGYNLYYSSSRGEGLFYDCPLENVYLGRNLSYNEGYAYGYSPFYNQYKLTSVIIGDSVTSIGDYAFSGCSRLTSTTISEGVTSIGYNAFYGCSSLSAVHITDIAAWCNIYFDCYYSEYYSSLETNPLYNAENLYLNGELVTELVIPEGVTMIGYAAFSGCSSLKSITIPSSVTSIGNFAFQGCEGLYKVINSSNLLLSQGTSDYGYVAYYAKQVINGSGLTTIGDFQFRTSSGIHYLVNYIGKETDVVLPNDYNGANYGIDVYAFYGCNLTSITIPEGVTSIGKYAFYNCSGELTVNCNIPSASSYENGAFYKSKFTKVTIGEGVTSIGNYAFAYCSSLTAVHISSIEAWCKIIFGDSLSNPLSYAHNLYLNGELVTNLVIPEGVTSIGDYAFSACSGLTAITIPEGVTSIGYAAFEDCSSLTAVHISSIEAWCKITFENYNSNPLYYVHNLYLNGELVTNLVIPEGVTSIGNYAFEGCRSLTAITLPEGVTSIGDYAFEGCRSLTAITLPEGVTSIGGWAFRSCNNLTSITIPKSVTSIGEAVFQHCSNLTAITIPEGVTSIGSSAFSGCCSLTSITIPKSVTSIGESAFSVCRSLTSIIIPEGVTRIGASAFDGCTSLKEVIFEDGSEALTLGYNYYSSSGTTGEGLFYDCPLENVCLGRDLSYNEGYEYGYSPFYNQDKLTSIIIGDSVTSIGNYAFCNCSSLTSINIPEGVTSIGSDAFSGCSGLKSLFVGTNVDTYGENVFEGCTAVEELAVMGSVMPTVPSDKFTTIWMFSPGPLDAEDFDAKVYRTATLYVPEGSLARYQMADVWKKFWYIEEFDLNEEIEVTLDRTTVTMTEGDVITLVATIEPQYIKTVAWTSSNTSVATVNAHGMVTAVAAGTTTITAKAGDKEATCVVNVLETRYVITYLVDGEVSATDTLTCGEAITLLEPTKEGYTFSGWSYVPETYLDMTSPVKIDIAGNADAMLYTNAPCTNTSYGDQFVGWHVLFDGDANTFFHSEYSEIESADGLDHYLRVDLGEGNELSFFSFTYTTRGNNTTCNPTEIIVEGANEEDGTYTTIAVLDNLPLGRGESYFSDELGNGIAYRYIRFRVTETNYNYKVYGHPYFYFAEFGMTRYAIKVHDDVMETLVMPDRDVTFFGDFSINKYLVTFKIGEEVIAADSLEYGAAIVVPEAPEKDDHTFNGWGEVAETVPAHDVTYEGSYTGNSYLLTYIVDGDTVQADSVAYGTAIILLDEPVKEGYTFSGWSEAPDTMPAEDVTISGMFTVNIYKVYYYVGEELIHTTEVPYGEAIPEYIYEPTKEDEIFEGWIGETYATMPAHDVTYVANITNDVLQLIIDNSQLTIYDLGGRKIEVDDLRELEKGVYIVNGRKVVIGD